VDGEPRQAAPVKVSREHLELAQRSDRDQLAWPTPLRASAAARRSRDGRRRFAARPPRRRRRLSTGVIGVPLPLDKVLPGLSQASGALTEDGGSAAAEAIMTTDTRPKQAAVHGPGFTVGGMAKGSGMIHPNLATMLAVVTTDYPLHPGEAIEFLKPAVGESFNAITVDGDCSTNDAVCLLANGARAVERNLDSDLAFAAALRGVCADLAQQIVADGEGATVLAEIIVTGAASDEEARALARRIATSPLVKTALFGHDANWGRVLAAAGSAPFNGGFAQLDPDLVTLRFDGTTVIEAGRPLNVEPDPHGDALSIELDLALGGRDLPDERLLPTPHQRGLPLMSIAVVKVGGNASFDADVVGVVDGLSAAHSVIVVHGAGPQISQEMERRGLPIEFVGGRRVTCAEALEIVRESYVTINARLCKALGPGVVGLFGDEIGLEATHVPELGLVGEALPSRPAAVLEALAAGLVPVIAPLAAGPLNVNADDAATALAVGLGADRIVFVSDVPGVLHQGAVVPSIAAGDAHELLATGELTGGMVPKLQAAVAAAKGGVRAEIGATVVSA
jgi:acetylglutamate kinase